MKIICDSCGAKYSIADEKVQGKVFKIRCKKCSEVIVVKGTDDGGGGGGGDYGSAYGNGAGAAEWYVVIDGERDGPITPEEIEAYYTIGKLGPETFVWRDGLDDWVMLNTLSEFAHLTADSAGPEEKTMIAARSPELADSPMAASPMAAAPAAASPAATALGMGGLAGLDGGDDELEDSTMVMESGRFEAGQFEAPEEESHAAVESGSYGSLSGASGGAGAANGVNNGYDSGYSSGGIEASAASTDTGGMDTGGGFDAGYDSGSGYDDGGYDDSDQGGMFAAFDSGDDSDYSSSDYSADAGPSLESSGGDDLVGARNDNSVLFSLSSVDQVKAVSKPGDGQAQGNDKSGLIDIQALASTQAALKGGGGLEDDDDADFAAGAMSVPALMPMGSHKKSNNGLIIGISIGGGLVVVALIVIVAVLLLRDGDDPQTQQVVAVAEESEEPEEEELSEEEAAEAEAAAEAARAALEAAEEEEEEEEEAEQEEEEAPRETARAERTPRQPRGDSGGAARPRQERQETRQTGSSIVDQLDRGQRQQQQQPAQQQQASRSDLPESLSRNMVSSTIRRYNAQIRSCSQNNPEGVSGQATVRFVVMGNGSVSSASAQDEFSGTTVGSCLEGVVRGMRFPETQDDRRTIAFPFPVR